MPKMLTEILREPVLKGTIVAGHELRTKCLAVLFQTKSDFFLITAIQICLCTHSHYAKTS